MHINQTKTKDDKITELGKIILNYALENELDVEDIALTSTIITSTLRIGKEIEDKIRSGIESIVKQSGINIKRK